MKRYANNILFCIGLLPKNYRSFFGNLVSLIHENKKTETFYPKNQENDKLYMFVIPYTNITF